MTKESKQNQSSSTIWGGRFAAGPDEIMQQINASIDVDQRLWAQDIMGSKAHCAMLMKQGILNAADGKAILDGLDQIAGEIESSAFVFKIELEDIHMNIETRLKEIIGDAAGRLHTARSRNDQVATDFRLWVREAIDVLIHTIEDFEKTLGRLIEDHAKTIMPGFTHLQAAQPVTLALHLDAYRQMILRDKSRLSDCQNRLNESPLGAAALAGTPYPIDRAMTAKELGFSRPMLNTMDAVSARDFACEFLFVTAQCGIHLSRLAEEIILWATPQFGFIKLSDRWSTGSSIMPQKKNPDAAELIRGKTGRLNGNLIQMLTVMKGLPLTYNKDMQEDKESVFDSFDTLMLGLQAMNGMLDSAEFNISRMLEAAEDGYTTATALADWLVMKLNIPFRQAHHITGAIVKMAEAKDCKLHELSLADMQAIEPKITDDIFRVLRVG